MSQHDDHLRQILEALEAGVELSQRALARRLAISLGSANQLLRRLIAQQWVCNVPGERRRVRYVVTPEGAAARARMAREQLGRALDSYGTVRDRLRERLEACTAHRANRGPSFRSAVALYGIGEAARIAFACAAELGVPLVGFIDECPRESFLGLPVRTPSQLTSMALDGRAFDWLFVATLADQDAIRGRLLEVGFPLDRVTWL